MARAAVDERGFEVVRRIRQAHGDMPLADFKALVREQFYMLLIDQEAALAAIPSMLPADAETRRKAFDLIDEVLSARGELSAEDKKRLQRGRPAVRRRRRQPVASPFRHRSRTELPAKAS